jgi:hypothetical protein
VVARRSGAANNKIFVVTGLDPVGVNANAYENAALTSQRNKLGELLEWCHRDILPACPRVSLLDANFSGEPHASLVVQSDGSKEWRFDPADLPDDELC